MAADSPTTEFRGGTDGQHDRLRSLGKYEIKKRLGAGGMGTVFLAVDRELNRTVALKVLPKERAENPTLVRRFKSEAQAAALLEHKNIVRVYEAGEADGFLYIALEYVEGIDVHELVARRGVLPVKRSIDIVRQIAKALEHASSRQIVHRDIKPANLLIKRDGTVKLADMGLARSIDEATETNITRAGMTVGTVDYMSPEQARSSQAADVRSDIYSLGCTWYHMLTGQPPFPDGGLTEKLQAHAVGKRPNPRIENDAVPEAVVAVMHRMMARKPDDRHQTPRDLIDDLDLASKSLSTLNASMLDALAEESSASSSRKSRPRSGSGPVALPPKDSYKPVDLATGKTIDIDLLRFAVPALLVVAVLGVLVWVAKQSGDALSGGDSIANPFPNRQQEQEADIGEIQPSTPDDAENNDESAEEQPVANLTGSRASAGPSPVIGVPFPGAEDARVTASGVPLIPNWVEKFRSDTSSPTRKIRVSRRASDDGEFRRLDEALAALPREGGTIELDGDGPFVLETTTVSSRGKVRISAAAGRHPVVFLSAGDQLPPSGSLLTVQAPQLEIENLHFVVVDPPAGDLTMLSMEDGDLALRNCSITWDGNDGSSATAIAVSGQARSAPRTARGSAFTGHCLLENVLSRGDRLTAVRMQGEASELVMGNCLVHSGDAAAVEVIDPGATEDSSSERSIRLLATTVISNRSAIHLKHVGDGAPAGCEVIVRKALLACSSPSAGEEPAMLVLDNWRENRSSIGRSRASGVDWSTSESVFLGWPSLVRMADSGGETSEVLTADEWRPFWNQALTSDAVIGLNGLPLHWDDPSTIVPRDVLPEQWSAVANGQPQLNVGCRPNDLSEIPFGMIRHVSIARRAPEVPEDFGAELPVNESQITFDLMKRSSLGNFLENDACRDGTHVIATGSGMHKLGPIVIADKAIRLEFRQTGSTPLMIQTTAARSDSEAQPATITLRNATLDLVGAQFKMPATSSNLVPPWLFRLEDASLSVRECTFTGPSTPSAGHSGFIQFADVSEAEQTDARHVLIEDSYLISPGQLLSGPIRWESMICRNSVFVSQSNIWSVQLDEMGFRSPAAALIEHCTLAADGATFAIEGEAPVSDNFGSLDVVVKESLFAGSVNRASSAAVVSRESTQQTESLVRWWGNANGFSPSLSRFVMTAGSPEPSGDFQSAWIATWGLGHEANPLTSATDVIFASAFPKWNDVTPLSFALNPSAPAATWASDRTAIGAELEQVGAGSEEDSAAEEDDSASRSRPRRPTKSPPRRSQNRNPF